LTLRRRQARECYSTLTTPARGHLMKLMAYLYAVSWRHNYRIIDEEHIMII